MRFENHPYLPRHLGKENCLDGKPRRILPSMGKKGGSSSFIPFPAGEDPEEDMMCMGKKEEEDPEEVLS